MREYGHIGVVFLMRRRPPRSTLDRSPAASDVYKRQTQDVVADAMTVEAVPHHDDAGLPVDDARRRAMHTLSLIHISEPTRPY